MRELNIKQTRGRPRKYADKAENMRAIRAQKKLDGYKDIHASIPDEYKKLLDKFCHDTQLSISELICYLLGCAQERDLPDIDRPIDFQKS